MAATIPADSAGDILEANPFAIQKFIVAGLLPPVPDDLVQWMTAEGRYNEALVKNNLYNGKYYGVPYLVGRHAIYYNTDMFAAAGLPADGPKTMDDLRNYAKKLAKYDAAGNLTVSGISLRLSGAGSGIAEKFWMYLYPMGGSLVEQTKSGKWHNNYNNEAGLATLQWYLDIVYKDKTNNPQIPADTAGFSQGVVAMYARESSPIGAIAKNAPNLKYATVPMPKGVRWGDLANGENLYVSKNSKYPEVAWDFVKFLETDRWLQELLKVSGWLPQRRDADLKEILAGQPAYKAFLFSDPEYKLYRLPDGAARVRRDPDQDGHSSDQSLLAGEPGDRSGRAQEGVGRDGPGDGRHPEARRTLRYRLRCLWWHYWRQRRAVMPAHLLFLARQDRTCPWSCYAFERSPLR